jgi:hypothetical protein
MTNTPSLEDLKTLLKRWKKLSTYHKKVSEVDNSKDSYEAMGVTEGMEICIEDLENLIFIKNFFEEPREE